ncbi:MULTISPECIES: phage protein NinX family protein [Acinetobacter]|uniref:Uncharacterized protein n=2 Tax=Acinetobacter TaxID=469 RepID=N8UXK2_9GAMM|nr:MULTISPECIES: phage protein NinX family protein [Acinetobacter]ENU92120.1 hypothetical protein F971_02007 [Acinetobacter vivianii]ENW92729.1 hypothetical protein F904_02672 [Acinetobacter dispersus]
MNLQVSQLTVEQLPHALMLAMKRKTLPVIDWELCGKIIEKEKRISLVAGYEKYSAMYIGLKSNGKKIEVEAASPIEAIVKCYIIKQLGYEVELN